MCSEALLHDAHLCTFFCLFSGQMPVKSFCSKPKMRWAKVVPCVFVWKCLHYPMRLRPGSLRIAAVSSQNMTKAVSSILINVGAFHVRLAWDNIWWCRANVNRVFRYLWRHRRLLVTEINMVRYGSCCKQRSTRRKWHLNSRDSTTSYVI